MLLTARKIPAQLAMDWGIVAQVVPDAELMDCARAWAGEIIACSPASIFATKAVMQSYYDVGLEASNTAVFALPEVQAMFAGADLRKGGTAFAEKRQPTRANPPGQ